jgi:DNA polymerase alpha subunit B
VLETLNPEIQVQKREEDSTAAAVRFESNINPKKFAYRTMYQKLSEASEILDQQIETVIEALTAKYPTYEAEIGNPAVSSQEPIVAVGRICSESLGDDTMVSKPRDCFIFGSRR